MVMYWQESINKIHLSAIRVVHDAKAAAAEGLSSQHIYSPLKPDWRSCSQLCETLLSTVRNKTPPFTLRTQAMHPQNIHTKLLSSSHLEAGTPAAQRKCPEPALRPWLCCSSGLCLCHSWALMLLLIPTGSQAAPGS